MNYKIEDVARFYSELLGKNYYNINVNCNFNTNYDAVQGILIVARKPFSIPSIDSETLEINLEFYVDSTKEVDKLRVLEELSKILGYRTGKFQSNNKEFTFNNYLEFNRTVTAPVVDKGNYTQVILINGTCLITGKKGGLIGNSIRTSLIINPGNLTDEIEGEVAVLESSSGLVKETESPIMANEKFAKSFNKSQVYSYSYTILLLKDKISEKLFKAAKNIEPFEINERIDLKENYPAFVGDSFSSTKKCIITDIQLSANAGAFMSVIITLQDKLDLQG